MKRMWSKEELTEEIAGGPVEALDASKFSLKDEPQAKVTASNAYKIGDMGIATIESIISTSTTDGRLLQYDGKVLYGTKIGETAKENILFHGDLFEPTVVIFEIY